jgi:eukaryotic-like serine/threonine-protein kinase
VLSPSNVAGLSLEWSIPAGECTDPAVVNGVVYAGCSTDHDDISDLYALIAAAGARLWRFQKATLGGFNSPAVASGMVYSGAGGTVYAFNAGTGAKVWTFNTRDVIIFKPTVVNGGGLLRLLWRHAVCPQRIHGGQAVDFRQRQRPSLLTSGGQRGGLRRLPQWQPVRAQRPHQSQAVDLRHRKLPLWDGGGQRCGLRRRHERQLLRSQRSYRGQAVDLHTYGGQIESSAAVANGVVYIGAGDGGAYALNAATGAKLWSFASGDRVFDSAAVANGVVYVGSDDNNVYALNAATEARLWSFTTGAQNFSSPAVANGVVYIASTNGNMYAFHLPGGQVAITRPAPGQLRPNYSLRPQNRIKS